MKSSPVIPLLFVAMVFVSALTAVPAGAVFHLMQIEQVIGGVDGSQNVQAIQLRMRSAFQNLISGTRLVAYDASGANPIVLITFPVNVANSAVGSRILAATAEFANATNPPLTPDFVLTNSIPSSYLAAGSLTFEDPPTTILWRISWGGESYTGSGAGALTNDADGDFNPPVAMALPSGSDQSLRFTGASSATSTNNAADYEQTLAPAEFTNNAGESGTILSLVAAGTPDGTPTLSLSAPFPNPTRSSLAYSVTLPEPANVRIQVFNPRGSLVRSLVHETLPAGRHAFHWNTHDGENLALPSGLYLLVMTVDGDRRVRRFVLFR